MAKKYPASLTQFYCLFTFSIMFNCASLLAQSNIPYMTGITGYAGQTQMTGTITPCTPGQLNSQGQPCQNLPIQIPPLFREEMIALFDAIIKLPNAIFDKQRGANINTINRTNEGFSVQLNSNCVFSFRRLHSNQMVQVQHGQLPQPIIFTLGNVSNCF